MREPGGEQAQSWRDSLRYASASVLHSRLGSAGPWYSCPKSTAMLSEGAGILRLDARSTRVGFCPHHRKEWCCGEGVMCHAPRSGHRSSPLPDIFFQHSDFSDCMYGCVHCGVGLPQARSTRREDALQLRASSEPLPIVSPPSLLAWSRSKGRGAAMNPQRSRCRCQVGLGRGVSSLPFQSGAKPGRRRRRPAGWVGVGGDGGGGSDAWTRQSISCDPSPRCGHTL